MLHWKGWSFWVPWKVFIEKVLSMLVSFKYHVFVASCVLVYLNKIDGMAWSAVVTILAGYRQAITLLSQYKNQSLKETDK